MPLIRRAFLMLASFLGLSPRAQAEGRNVRLPLPPLPENAAALAQRAVEAAKNIDGIVLDYTPESLAQVDRIILGFRTGVESDAWSAVFAFGCYVGEVFVREGKAVWVMPNDQEQRVGFSTMGLRANDGQFLNPIGKAFKLLKNGSEDSVLYFYRVFTKN